MLDLAISLYFFIFFNRRAIFFSATLTFFVLLVLLSCFNSYPVLLWSHPSSTVLMASGSSSQTDKRCVDDSYSDVDAASLFMVESPSHNDINVLFADKLPSPCCRSKKTASSSVTEDEFITQLKATFGLQLYDVILLNGLESTLRTTDFEGLAQSPECVIITVGQLKAGLRLPIYNPDNPFAYEVLSRLRPHRALTQWTGSTFRLISAWEGRGKGIDCIPAEQSSYSPENAPAYSADNFIANYCSGTSTLGDLAGFSASPHRVRVMPSGMEPMMVDVDPIGQGGHELLRKFQDPNWDEIPLLVSGPILHGGYAAPPNPDAYPFWVVNRDKVFDLHLFDIPNRYCFISSFRQHLYHGHSLPRPRVAFPRRGVRVRMGSRRIAGR